ncbi:MAG: response regulator [Nitrospirae bacterium]|nr:response regulator [Nitrospirota bacterium]
MKGKILVFDDEPLILKSIDKTLARIGYEVTTVQKREDFISKIKEKDFLLLIFDLHIPEITKEEIMNIALRENPDIKFLIISGSDETEGIPFLRKPFEINELRKMVKEILDD